MHTDLLTLILPKLFDYDKIMMSQINSAVYTKFSDQLRTFLNFADSLTKLNSFSKVFLSPNVDFDHDKINNMYIIDNYINIDIENLNKNFEIDPKFYEKKYDSFDNKEYLTKIDSSFIDEILSTIIPVAKIYISRNFTEDDPGINTDTVTNKATGKNTGAKYYSKKIELNTLYNKYITIRDILYHIRFIIPSSPFPEYDFKKYESPIFTVINSETDKIKYLHMQIERDYGR